MCKHRICFTKLFSHSTVKTSATLPFFMCPYRYALYLLLSASLLWGATFAYAQQSQQYSYAQAYGICTPIAHQIAKNKCGYGSLYENFYLQCMRSRGVSEQDDGSYDYQQYMQAYGYCSSTADQQTKNYCQYGSLYSVEYHKCMAQYGFNPNGEREYNPDPYSTSPADSNGRTFQFDF